MTKLAAIEIAALDAYFRKMTCLMPRMAKAVPFLGCIVVSAAKAV